MSGLYEALLAIHIIAAAIWVGGNFAVQYYAVTAKRRGPEALGAFAKDTEWYGQRVNAGSSLVLLAAGFGLVAEGNWSLGDFWISIALAAWIASFVVGAGFLGPQSKKLGESLERSGGAVTGESQALLDRIFLVSRIELAVLVLVIVDMAVKPGA